MEDIHTYSFRAFTHTQDTLVCEIHTDSCVTRIYTHSSSLTFTHTHTCHDNNEWHPTETETETETAHTHIRPAYPETYTETYTHLTSGDAAVLRFDLNIDLKASSSQLFHDGRHLKRQIDVF